MLQKGEKENDVFGSVTCMMLITENMVGDCQWVVESDVEWHGDGVKIRKS